jgi:L-methionine (R)-S-oxide reductase
MSRALTALPAGDKPAQYALLLSQAAALVAGERDFIANCANVGALLYFSLEQLNWAGVYLLKHGELVLGPFQGQPACARIAPGKGVCGTAAVRRRTLIVPNVHEFDGHIACDSASNSEIVVPLMRGSQLIGVLDLDSPVLSRFDREDQEGLERIAASLVAASDI